MHEITIGSLQEFEERTTNSDACLLYFSHNECNVCKVLKPKIKELLSDSFPRIAFGYIDVKKTPDIAAQQRIFTVPAIVVYFGGREYIRKSRHIGIAELATEIERPYSMATAE